MNNENKLVESISPVNFAKHPIWRFDLSGDTHESSLKPIKRTPVKSLAECIVGTEGRLNSGGVINCAVGNISIRNRVLNAHLPTLSVWTNGAWFHLARYWDADYITNGPSVLARLLESSVSEVFPITVDLSRLVKGAVGGLVLTFFSEPESRLTEREIIREIVKDSMSE